jgi:hypothetical protein
MKYLILILLIFIPLAKSIAQIKCPDVSDQKSKTKNITSSTFGIRMAYNNTTVTKISASSKISNLNRLQIGVFAKCYLLKNWFLKGNLIYNQKGNFYTDFAYLADAGKQVTIKLNYIEASLDFGYTIKIKQKQNIYTAIGTYLAYGLNGTEKGFGESLLGPIKIDKKVVFTNSKHNNGTYLQINPVDFGLNFNIDYQYGRYGLYINYGLGLTKLEDEFHSKNRVVSVGVSYKFNNIVYL